MKDDSKVILGRTELPSTRQVWVGDTRSLAVDTLHHTAVRVFFSKAVFIVPGSPLMLSIFPGRIKMAIFKAFTLHWIPTTSLAPDAYQISLGSFFQPHWSLFSFLNTDAPSSLQPKLIPLPGVPSTLQSCCSHSSSQLNPAQASDLSLAFFKEIFRFPPMPCPNALHLFPVIT